MPGLEDIWLQLMMLLSPFLRDVERVHLNQLVRAYTDCLPAKGIGQPAWIALPHDSNPAATQATPSRRHACRSPAGRLARLPCRRLLGRLRCGEALGPVAAKAIGIHAAYLVATNTGKPMRFEQAAQLAEAAIKAANEANHPYRPPSRASVTVKA